jgi:hypothetical protein
MTPKTLQRLLGFVFISMGSWCALFPRAVEELTIRPEHQVLNATTEVFISCFGAQAVLCGFVILLSRFTSRTFLWFGLFGSVPFFAFNAYFYYVEPIFTRWMLLDFVGNLVILACGWFGFRVSSDTGRSSMTVQAIAGGEA